ncbi:putative enoyl-CoA hydratase echA14 [Frankia sp. Hr75.2]|nr:putative enoyl-CoA hydratase echA14 [Frankia sp. Hr75.2]
MEPSVLLEQRGAVSIVTLHRPGRRNGVTVQMCEELYEALSPVPASDARVVVLRGAGNDFSVGADLTGGHSAEPATLERLGAVYHASTLLHTMPQLTIAAIDGGCAGAAMGWACACDFRFASDRARFATGFLKVGVSGDMGLVWSLARLVGAPPARHSEPVVAAGTIISVGNRNPTNTDPGNGRRTAPRRMIRFCLARTSLERSTASAHGPRARPSTKPSRPVIPQDVPPSHRFADPGYQRKAT